MANLTIKSKKASLKCKDGRTMKNVIFFPTTGKVVGGVLKLKRGGMEELDDATFKAVKVGIKVTIE